ncbi:fatty acid desaturase family protein [Chitinophaga nivalis]|uniref:Acyl-CoA desaturase n=1 Tax=Chitinophaga nivalis TaxID=2991709 RepID=A0ABT3IKB7_9BACT|nr:acyl-CoA desaturase [Chitinophaga nivalis]MCW3465902.1 acyl-CoA desaturase [Chitinophaga nivalis]MCW3484407.1 acyl-CoA desaturase [Chitinophaga nivalis]
MKMKKINIVRFAPKGSNSFIETLTAAVHDYFRSNNISPYANAAMWLKTAIMLLCYFVPCIFIILGAGASNLWLFWGLWFLMGWGMIGIGTAVMHDANHGTYSPHKKINIFIGHILEVIGGYSVNWKIQHNMLHHTYTNIDGLDEDISSTVLLRLSPQQRRYWFHRHQHIYAWFFYALMTLYWMTAKDYLQVIRFKQRNLLHKQKVSLPKALMHITWSKMFYYAYILVLPLLFSGQPWYFVLTGFFIMHLTAGLFLSCVFQPAHIMPNAAFAAPVVSGDSRQMKDSWAVHELVNTINFAPRNAWLSWFIGGLNYQIEHHLFTDICHVHYRKIAPIVKATAASFGLPYQVQPTFLRALREHSRMLKILGKK